ncbi:hypothetical protein LS73_002195 [Helicobacter muridarum]|uniref:Outer membrane protein n=1 Tax=Helicobacter muridarum TaxID=216 RepID=A0A099U0W0_9HELI|nr:hypothetical protein [Helicobacter muridarum]TLE01108.1 hypothetical protein LS73_002195 [Helicobacter muridarum]STQ85973.1 Uncharacterised protein [Helicobacter muridarum]
MNYFKQCLLCATVAFVAQGISYAAVFPDFIDYFNEEMEKNTKYGAWGYRLSAGTQYYSYKEVDGDNNRLMKISGAMAGFDTKVTNSFSNLTQSISGGYYKSINTKYEGQACTITPNTQQKNCFPYNASSNDYYYFTEYIINPHIVISRVHVGLDIGVGYRFAYNKYNDPNAYKREQHYVYYLAGLNIGAFIGSKVSITLNAQYRRLIRGWNKTYMTDIGYDSDLNFEQKNGSGYAASLMLSYNPNNKYSIFLKAYYQYWNILESDVKDGYKKGQFIGNYVEPNNYTHVIGLNIGIGL